MEDESSGSVDNLVSSVFQTARAQWASLVTGTHLAWAEVRVVASHAGLLLGLLFVAAGMLLVGWGLILVVAAFLLIGMGFSTLLALLCVVVLNLTALMVVCLYMRHTLKSISFSHTRAVLGIRPQAVSGKS